MPVLDPIDATGKSPDQVVGEVMRFLDIPQEELDRRALEATKSKVYQLELYVTWIDTWGKACDRQDAIVEQVEFIIPPNTPQLRLSYGVHDVDVPDEDVQEILRQFKERAAS